MLRKMVKMSKEELGLKSWFLPLGTYPLKEKVEMEVSCVTLGLSLRKGGYVGHLQCYRMRRSPTAWANLYGVEVLIMGDTIFARDDKKFTKTACPTQGTWFGKFARGYKLRMGVIKKQDFEVTS